MHWDHVDLDGDPSAARPVPPSMAVWHSVRQGGDTKTAKSRRTLALPQAAVQALKEHRKQQMEDRLAAGALWQEHGLVFASAIGTPLDAANVRREFRKITEAAGLGTGWAPRDLRHTFVSLMSADGVPIEEIARLASPGPTSKMQSWIQPIRAARIGVDHGTTMTETRSPGSSNVGRSPDGVNQPVVTLPGVPAPVPA